MTTPIYQVKAEFFKTLGHPARIRVLEVLRDGERTVSDLVPAVGIEASHLSQQLAVLRRANLVQARKEGTSVLYSVETPRSSIFSMSHVGFSPRPSTRPAPFSLGSSDLSAAPRTRGLRPGSKGSAVGRPGFTNRAIVAISHICTERSGRV